MSENENGKHIHINATVITVVCLLVFCAVLFIMGKFGEKKLLKAANDVANSNDTTEQQVLTKIFDAATIVPSVILLLMFILTTFCYKLGKSEIENLHKQLYGNKND